MKIKWKLLYYVGVILGSYRDNGKENGNYLIMLGLYWGYSGIKENKMETTIKGLGFRGAGGHFG